ncbi:endonuclease/exonuclease/phosphatase family protein [Rhizobium lusitanum]|uniref:endonuclease/exonuclease/phosphatase family protein n=1 Tax=Rhizobium lusitanum TaxID=293958 RepID=UPI0032B2FCA0
MKLATYKVNGINGRLDVLLRWIDEAKPDVVCLQELKAPDEKFPRREIERAGYGAIRHGQKAWNGAHAPRLSCGLVWRSCANVIVTGGPKPASGFGAAAAGQTKAATRRGGKEVCHLSGFGRSEGSTVISRSAATEISRTSFQCSSP